MNLNIFFPGKAIDDAFAKPSTGLALVIVLIPALFSIIFSFFLGIALDPLSIIYNIAKGYIYFFVLAIVLYIVGYIFRGKELSGHFNGVISATSLLWIFTLIIAVLGVFLVIMVPKDAITMVDFLKTNGATASEVFSSSAFQNLEIPDSAIAAFTIVLAIGAIVLIWAAYYLYKLIKELTGKSALASLAILVVLVILAAFIRLP